MSIPAISLAEIREAAEMPAIQVEEVAFPVDMHCPPAPAPMPCSLA